MIDTHCHVQFNAYKDDAEVVIKKCQDAGMILNVVGSQQSTSARAVEYAEKYENIFATIGVHPVHLFPTFVDEAESGFQSRQETFDYEYYKSLAQNKKVVAIGECGLEFFHLPEGFTKEEVLAKQTETFLLQHKLATEMNLPLVIHVRDAHQEMIDLLKTLTAPIKGVIHCYTGDWTFAQQYLALGLNLGFTGVITFAPKKTNPQPQLNLLEVVKNVPLDRMVIETDSPYLAPQAYRGQRCEPWMVVEVAKKIAEIKNLGLEEVDKLTSDNATRLFGFNR